MVEINDELIAYLEQLSRLNLSEEEKENAKKNLKGIFEHIDNLNELNTSGVEPVSHPFPFTNFFRDDEVEQSYSRDDILLNAPQKKDGCFSVPKTLE